jgi:hypothetical protein
LPLAASHVALQATECCHANKRIALASGIPMLFSNNCSNPLYRNPGEYDVPDSLRRLHTFGLAFWPAVDYYR